MNKILLFSLFVGSLVSVNAQTSVNQKTVKETAAVSKSISFDEFCLKNATQIIVETSKSIKVTGSVPALDTKIATYKDYGVVLKENEAQYFTIEGSTNLLKVESLYRLRLMYNQTTK